MALVSLMGFQEWDIASVGNLDDSSVNFFPLDSLKTGLGVPLGVAGYFTSQPNAILEFPDSRGVRRKGLGRGAGASAQPYLAFGVARLKILPKTGKWYFGVRYYGPQVGTMAQIRMSSNNATIWNPSVQSTDPVSLYYELVVDWKLGEWSLYVNKTRVLGGQAIASTASGYASFVLGSQTATATAWAWTDMYWVVEEADEPHPLDGPLGPIFVQQAPIKSVDNADLFTPPGALSVGDQWNVNNKTPAIFSTSGVVANAVATSPTSEAATVHFTEPTESAPILAVSWQLASFKESGATAGTVSQAVDGDNSLPQSKEVPSQRPYASVNRFGSAVALDGSAWTKEAVGRTVLNVGSYRP